VYARGVERADGITWREVWRRRGAGDAPVAPASGRQTVGCAALLVAAGLVLDALVHPASLRAVIALLLFGCVYLWTRRERMRAARTTGVAAEEARWPLRLVSCIGVLALPWFGDAHIAVLFAAVGAVDLAVGDAYLRRGARRTLRTV
jgi:hypothetical protein